VAGLRDIAEVVAAPDARFAPCFVRRDRGVTCAGRDLGLHDVVALRVVDDSSSAHGHYVAWLPDGSARAFDVGDPKSMLVIPAAQRAVDYSGDDRHYCTVDARGQVACGGSTCKDGTCTAPTLAPVVEHARSVATFGATSCALLADGTVSCWGANIGGALGRIPGDAWNRGERDDMKDWPPGLVSGVHDAVQLRAYELGFCVAVRDGSLACWGTLSELNRDGHLEQVLPPGSLDGPFVGGTDGCTLRKNGLVACWGRNAAGRLGDGSIAKLVMPAAVPGLD